VLKETVAVQVVESVGFNDEGTQLTSVVVGFLTTESEKVLELPRLFESPGYVAATLTAPPWSGDPLKVTEQAPPLNVQEADDGVTAPPFELDVANDTFPVGVIEEGTEAVHVVVAFISTVEGEQLRDVVVVIFETPSEKIPLLCPFFESPL
jgi:hypothetical protein